MATYENNSKAIDELAGTWTFNDAPDLYSLYNTVKTYNLKFTSNGTEFSGLQVVYLFTNGGEGRIMEYIGDTSCEAYRQHSYYGGWSDGAYKIITITSLLAEVDNGSTLLAWLKDNATKQVDESEPEPEPEQPEITIPEGEHGEIYYKGKLIAVLTEGQTVTLHTEGFKAVEDIVIKYPSPKIITFYINNREYKALDGMTWEDWVANTSYNVDGCYCYENDNYVYCNGRIIYDDDLNSVNKMDKIISGHKYQFDTSGGGSN